MRMLFAMVDRCTTLRLSAGAKAKAEKSRKAVEKIKQKEKSEEKEEEVLRKKREEEDKYN